MPLILLSGYPSSGLTYRAQQIISHFTAHPPSTSSNFSIQHISDDILNIPRSAYDTARTEKDARAALSSAIKRHLGRETLVICDAMNYIKGFRYQMWCEAKAAGTTCCVVHVAVTPEQATSLHQQRMQSNETTDSTNPKPALYEPSTFANLISRYEEPSASARWDSPLFTLPYSDPDPPYEGISSALFSSNKPKPKKGIPISEPTSTDSPPSQTPVVKPHLVTVAPKAMSSDALYILERATSTVVQSILNYLSTAGITECSGETITISTVNEVSRPDVSKQEMSKQEAHPEETPQPNELTLQLPPTGTLSVAHLQRLKRQFVSLYRSRGVGMGAASSAGVGGLAGGELSEERVMAGFVAFLENGFQGE